MGRELSTFFGVLLEDDVTLDVPLMYDIPDEISGVADMAYCAPYNRRFEGHDVYVLYAGTFHEDREYAPSPDESLMSAKIMSAVERMGYAAVDTPKWHMVRGSLQSCDALDSPSQPESKMPTIREPSSINYLYIYGLVVEQEMDPPIHEEPRDMPFAVACCARALLHLKDTSALNGSSCSWEDLSCMTTCDQERNAYRDEALMHLRRGEHRQESPEGRTVQLMLDHIREISGERSSVQDWIDWETAEELAAAKQRAEAWLEAKRVRNAKTETIIRRLKLQWEAQYGGKCTKSRRSLSVHAGELFLSEGGWYLQGSGQCYTLPEQAYLARMEWREHQIQQDQERVDRLQQRKDRSNPEGPT